MKMKMHMAAWILGLSLVACGGVEPSEEALATPEGQATMAIYDCPLPVMKPQDGSTLRYPTTCCGNGICELGESSSTCPSDCGPSTYCGDGYCNGSETSSTCPSDCSSCLKYPCDPLPVSAVQ